MIPIAVLYFRGRKHHQFFIISFQPPPWEKKKIWLTLTNSSVVDIFNSKGRQIWGESGLEENLKVRQNCLLKCTLRLLVSPRIQYVVFKWSCSIWKPTDAKVLLCFLWSQFKIKFLTLLLSKSPAEEEHIRSLWAFHQYSTSLCTETPTLMRFHTHKKQAGRHSRAQKRGQLIRKVQCSCKRNYENCSDYCSSWHALILDQNIPALCKQRWESLCKKSPG